jgi:O-antigen/teichoic acid export membrane protein
MQLVRKFVAVIGVQSLGYMSLFIVVWAVGHRLGPEAQGRFSVMKSFVDLMVTVLLFGFPQSFIYGINRLGVTRGRLARLSLLYGGVVCLVLLLVLAAMQQLGSDLLSLPTSALGSALVALTIGGLVAHGLLRGILLTIDDHWRFSLLTSFPALALCIVSVALLALGRFDPAAAYSAVGIISLVAAVLMIRSCLSEKSGRRVPWKDLAVNGGSVFVQSALMALQPFLTLSLLQHYGNGYQAAAFFSLATYANQAVLVPLTMTTPLLFNRWSAANATVAGDLRRMAWPIGFVTVASIAGWAAVPWVVETVFGPGYRGAAPAVQVMVLAIPFVFITQIGMPALMSLGKFRSNAFMAFLRLCVCLAALSYFLLGTSSVDSAKMAAVASLLAELTTVLVMAVLLMKTVFRTSCVRDGV